MQENEIVDMIKKYGVSSNDRVILNGGEPTLHPNLIKFLQLFHMTGAEIVLYTNGRKLKDNDYCYKLVQMVERIVIPIHGEESVHDVITRKKGSFHDTMYGIRNVLEIDNKKLEIKFIVTNDMILSDFSINEFLINNRYNPNNLALTGVVSTNVSQFNKFPLPSSDELGKYISRQLNSLIYNFTGSIKLFDCELCHLTDELREYIDNLPLEVDNRINYNFFYFDGKYNTGKLIHYNEIRHCEKCNLTNICRRITDACIVLEICHNRKKIVLE